MFRAESSGYRPHSHKSWLVLFLFLVSAVRVMAVDDGHLVTYHDLIDPGNICPTAGSTTLAGTVIGKATYLGVYYRNEGTGDLTIDDTAVINATGCDVVWEQVGESGVIGGNGSFWFGYICFRPTAATWSFQISAAVSGDPLVTTYTHTFTASGVPMGAGAQGALSLAPDSTTPGTLGLMVQRTNAAVKEPIQVTVSVISRSAVTPLAIPAGTWQVQGTPTNCTAVTVDSMPVSLPVDEAGSQSLRVFPTAAGSFSATFLLASNDANSPYSVTIFGTAVALPRLSVFNGSVQVDGTYSTIGISDAVVGVPRPVALTLRNDDSVPISFTAAITVPINCTATTTTAPTTTLAPGGTTVWGMSVTATATGWQFLPKITVGSPAARTIDLGVTDRAADYRYNEPGPLPPRFEPDTGAGSDPGGCGVGSGSVAALLSLLLLVAAWWRRE